MVEMIVDILFTGWESGGTVVFEIERGHLGSTQVELSKYVEDEPVIMETFEWGGISGDGRNASTIQIPAEELLTVLLTSCSDLVIRDLSHSPTSPTTKTEITFSATVENIGNRTSGPNKLTFKVGGETVPDTFDVPALDPGETYTVQRKLLLEVAQNYQNTVTVDVNDDVSESREDNNQAKQFYTVSPVLSYRVGAYYYPWYYNDFHGGQYLREHLVPPQLPELGEYNDRTEAVINQHLDWSRFAGIDFWVASWWGPGSREDVTLVNHILPNPNLNDIKIAVFYETTGRTDNFEDYENLGPDITYIANNYFNHPNYLKINNKPVLFIYLTRVLSGRGTLQSSLTTIRNAASAAGYQIFIVGDQVFGSPPSSAGDIALLDAITNYDVYGSMGASGYATQASVNSYYSAQSGWKALAQGVNVGFIPGTAPGFNDKGVRDGHYPLSRKLTADQEFGSLFRAMVDEAKKHVDGDLGNMLMVTSWNEWHEDTQIEPVRLTAPTSTDDSPPGSDYTTGLSYEGYGERYLRILREETDP